MYSHKKILIISLNDYNKPCFVYPLATAYLKTHLLSNIENISVDILDVNLSTHSQIQEYITNSKPDYICLSLRNIDPVEYSFKGNFLDKYKLIIKKLREVSKAPLILGGAGFSVFPELLCKELDIDYAIAGEGEFKLSNLLKNLIENKDFKTDNTLYIPTENLDCTYKSTPLIYEKELVDFYWKHSGILNIQTKRGCPFGCIYCTYPKIEGKCIRNLNVESIVESIARLKRDSGVNYFFFTDSVFNINNNYNTQLAQAMIDAKLDLSWCAYFCPKNLSDEQMALYRAAGLSHIEFGSESFSDKTLKSYNKNFTFDDVVKSSELALKHNIYYSHFIILGGYKDTKEEIDISISNSKYLKHTVIFTQTGMRIYPNTALHKIAIEENVISPEDNLLIPKFYFSKDFDFQDAKAKAMATKKAWIFPDDNEDNKIPLLRKRNKKGPLWEYLRKA